jgi:pimeloyl-ACP methyl ester carboxylesterase
LIEDNHLIEQLHVMGKQSMGGKVTKGSVYHLWRAARLLLRNLISESNGVPEPIRCTTPQGFEYDLYEPRSSTLHTILLVYGMTVAGEEEARLTRFARALTISRFRVVVPNLPGLKAYRFDNSDLNRLGNLVEVLSRTYASRIRVVAFSTGAGMSLTVASWPEVADCVDLLLLFSPYYSIDILLDRLQNRLRSEPTSDSDWDDFIWCQLVMAYRQREVLKLSEQNESELVYLLKNYCSRISLREKRKFYENVLYGHRVAAGDLEVTESRELAAFSPKGKLSSVVGRVWIMHDPFDAWSSYHDSQDIITELSQRGRGHAQRLLVSPLISHVSPRYAWRLPDIMYALNMFGELFH